MRRLRLVTVQCKFLIYKFYVMQNMMKSITKVENIKLIESYGFNCNYCNHKKRKEIRMQRVYVICYEENGKFIYMITKLGEGVSEDTLADKALEPGKKLLFIAVPYDMGGSALVDLVYPSEVDGKIETAIMEMLQKLKN